MYPKIPSCWYFPWTVPIWQSQSVNLQNVFKDPLSVKDSLKRYKLISCMTAFLSSCIGKDSLVFLSLSGHLTQDCLWGAQWPNDKCAGLRIGMIRPRALAGALRCVIGQDTLLSKCLSPPRYINGYRRI